MVEEEALPAESVIAPAAAVNDNDAEDSVLEAVAYVEVAEVKELAAYVKRPYVPVRDPSEGSFAIKAMLLGSVLVPPVSVEPVT